MDTKISYEENGFLGRQTGRGKTDKTAVTVVQSYPRVQMTISEVLRGQNNGLSERLQGPARLCISLPHAVAAACLRE